MEPRSEDVRGRTLRALEAWLEASSEREVQAICAALRQDPRAGARRLGERWERRVASIAAERERMNGLFARRRALQAGGKRFVGGVDEVGVGPLAGPVVAAAVVLRDEVELPGLDDSKKLSVQARERLDIAIRAQAIAFGIGLATVDEIDRINIHRAALLAMQRAVGALRDKTRVDHLMVDARTIPGVPIAQTPLVRGDSEDGSIAAASIVAKVHRDALLRALDQRYPGYGLARHKGYGTAEHIAALRGRGPTPEHRRSFAPVADAEAAFAEREGRG